MTRDQFSDLVDVYLVAVKDKLMEGWDRWQDQQAGALSTPELWAEIAAEGIDVTGWGFWVWLRSQQ